MELRDSRMTFKPYQECSILFVTTYTNYGQTKFHFFLIQVLVFAITKTKTLHFLQLFASWVDSRKIVKCFLGYNILFCFVFTFTLFFFLLVYKNHQEISSPESYNINVTVKK